MRARADRRNGKPFPRPPLPKGGEHAPHGLLLLACDLRHRHHLPPHAATPLTMRTDIWLDWLNQYRAHRDKQLAKTEADRAETLWELNYVASLAVTMAQASPDERRRCSNEITDLMQHAGHWAKPEE